MKTLNCEICGKEIAGKFADERVCGHECLRKLVDKVAAEAEAYEQINGGRMTLKCQCCGHAQEFEAFWAAYRAGWDGPPYFTGYVCCNLCPAVCILLGKGHVKAHAKWAREGRPINWTKQDCGFDDDITETTIQ